MKKNHYYKKNKINNLSFKEHVSFASDYAKKLKVWRLNFLKNWGEIEKLGFYDKFK